MLWRCPACNRQTDEPVCSRCQTPMEAGEPSAATGLLKETAGSVVFLIAVICLTAAVVFSAVFSFFSPAVAVDVNDVKSAVTSFSEVTGTDLNPYALKAISVLYDAADSEAVAQSEGLPLGNVLALVGLWLCLAQGYTNRVNFRKGGPIVLKVYTVIGKVAAIIVTVCGVLLGVGLWLERAALVELLSTEESDAVVAAVKNLLACETTMWLLLGLCAVMVVGGLLYLLFFISATRAVNSALFTAKTGDFGKRAGGLAGVMLCLAFLGMAADAGVSLWFGNLNGIGSALYALAFLFFAIVLFRYRRRSHALSWEQPAFSGETAAAMPSIPVGLKASDLMSDRPTVAPAPMSVPAENQNPQAPTRTLNEPFREESLEPQPMTGNGCCPQCGTPIPDNAFFCLKCGHKLK